MGVYFSNPNASRTFIYVFSGMHLIHIIAGLLILVNVIIASYSNIPQVKKPIQNGNGIYILAFSRYYMDLSVCFFTFEPILKQNTSVQMSTALTQQVDEIKSTPWSGGRSPFDVEYGKMMMWFFLLSDAFTFSSLLIAYGAIRFSAPVWPAPGLVFQSIPWFDRTRGTACVCGFDDVYTHYEFGNYGACR